MAVPTLDASAEIEPIRQLVQCHKPAVLAVITSITGPSYRPLGAMMAVFADQTRVGTLSSGCVEADIALHALEALEGGKPKLVNYGIESPFADIQLPCGGGLEITLLPNPDQKVLQEMCARHGARQAATLAFDMNTGRLQLCEEGATGKTGTLFQCRIEPELFFYVFGKGPEATTFAGLVQSAGYPNLLLSPDEETLEILRNSGGKVRHLTSAAFPSDLRPDARSAILLFFHDHEWEPPILAEAVKTDAFYIGAQGSQRAAELRRIEMQQLGVNDDRIAKVKGPIGLIPSARDARKLAISVLADVVREL